MADPTLRIFISYARSDGEAFATTLRQRLERDQPDLTLWRDREAMEGGVGWWRQIQDALDHVEYMVLVATPNAMTSKVMRDEWHYARQQGVCIYPVQVPGQPLDFPSLPRWMRDVHFYDLDHEWERFISGLRSPCQQTRVPFMAPDLPDDFVERLVEFDQLVSLLLDADRANPVAITTALRGAGGFGKTTLAAALCHDEDVITCFDDGILWVTLGENPSVKDGLTTLYVALTGDTPRYPTEEGIAGALSEKLAGKDCLIVIDDVWNTAHLRPFLRGGERCARLITTRKVEIAQDAAAQPIHVDEMTGDESVQMLVRGLVQPPGDLEPFVALAARLGEWPLLLDLANAALRRRMGYGDSLARALAWVHTALDKRGAGAFDRRDAEERNQAIAKSVGISLDLLEPDERQHYAELAIFPEDVGIPLVTIGQMWELDEFDTEEVAQRLAELSLLRLDLERGIIRLHDVMRAYVIGELEHPAPLHQRLLDAWGGDVFALPADDPYAWRWIAYHLHGAGHDDVLRALFADQRWMERRFEHDGYAYTGYLTDLMVAWKDVAHVQALAQIEAGDEPAVLADCVRYGLIHSSINSLAGNYVPELVAQAVETGLWTAERALSITERVPDARDRAKMYTALLKTSGLTPDQRVEAQSRGLDAALATWNEQLRAHTLAALAPLLAGDQKTSALRAGLDAVLAIRYGGDQVHALAALAPQLDGDLLRVGLDAALALDDEQHRAHALAALASRLEGNQKTTALQAGLDAALALEYGQHRARALAALALQLDEDQKASALQAGLDAALALEYEVHRADALAALAPQLEGDQKTTALQAGLDAALAIWDVGDRADALAALAPQLEGDQKTTALQAGLDAALAIRGVGYRADALAALAPQLEGDLLCAGLDAALAVRGVGYRADALAALAPQLEGDLLCAGLDAALTLEDEWHQAHALAALALQLDEDQKASALQTGLGAALALTYAGYRADALAALAPLLEGDQKNIALQVGLDAALALEDEWRRIYALAPLVPLLEDDQKTTVLQSRLDAALAIAYEPSRAGALAKLAPLLEGDQKNTALQAGLDAALALDDEHHLAHALAALAPLLAGDQKNTALQAGLSAALSFEDEGNRVWALAALAPLLEGDQKNTALQAGLDTALAIRNESNRASALAALAPQLTDDLLRIGLDAALAILDARHRASALMALAPQLTGDLLRIGLDAALVIRDERHRIDALAAFLPVHPDTAALIKHIRQAVVEHLLVEIQSEKRERVLDFIANERIFAPPVVAPDTLAPITRHIIEICQDWTWL
jgi:hypothetical protein